MGSGAPATRAVAQIVLLDGEFAAMPGVVAEGRRVIANVERVANLFVTKTVYAMLLAFVVGVARWPYPFLPRHLTIISSLTIGMPAFFLALGPNLRRYEPGFVRQGLAVLGADRASSRRPRPARCTWSPATPDGVSLDEAQTAATIVLFVVGLWVLTILARPWTPLRVAVDRGDGRAVRRRGRRSPVSGTSSRSDTPPAWCARRDRRGDRGGGCGARDRFGPLPRAAARQQVTLSWSGRAIGFSGVLPA